jgi:tRNA 2-selenouridine synthase
MPNPDTLHATDLAALSGFDAVIDVRSPAEFAEDHVPGAINLPVLSNEERAVVGTIYVQESPFRARRVGAALVAKNVAHHLETALAGRPSSFRPLIYCWRGGQRSNAMATILAQIGWRTLVLGGGYRTYRRMVQARLYEWPLGLDLILLDGLTGTGKTAVLQGLEAFGVQTLDLEGLAEHRGSLFGGLPGAMQPSQKLFETRLAAALTKLDAARPVVVEAEAHKIGDRMVPPALWQAMGAAPRLLLTADRAERARYLAAAYADIAADPAVLTALIDRLPVHVGKADREGLLTRVASGDRMGLADGLIALHYDPAYLRVDRKTPRPLMASLAVDRLDPEGIAETARKIADLIRSRSDRPEAQTLG